MSKKRNIIGNKYGKLTVIAEAGQSKENHFQSLVRCECGKEFIARDTILIHGRTKQCKQCSIDSHKTHGMSKDRLFFIWQSMRARCNNSHKKVYKDYGGRGIKVCDEWNNSFESFRDWAFSNGYSETLTIDRIDVNGNYEPSNCRWATILEQARNRRDNVMVDYEGKPTQISVVSELTGIKKGTIYHRIHHGWTDFDATHDTSNHSIDVLDKYQIRKRREVDITTPSGEKIHFNTMSDASKYLGYGVGFLSNRWKRGKSLIFTVNNNLFVLSEHYITERTNGEHYSKK